MSISTVHKALTIPEAHHGQRLDTALAKLLPEYSRSLLKMWIDSEQVTRNGKSAKPKEKVLEGDEIIIDVEMHDRTKLIPEKMPLDIVFEDAEVIIVHKPAGIVVHPGSGNWGGTLVNALLHHCPDLSKLPRAGLIHRIDKDTSGLLVVAKTLPAHTSLVDQLQQRSMQRHYCALVQGELISGGTIEAPIARHPRDRVKMAVVPSGKPAVTHYRIQQRMPHYTLLKVKLETGRTHQIRVHMAHKGYPLVGDPVYGGRLRMPKNCTEEVANHLQSFSRQALHAQSLGFIHPATQSFCEWTAPIPQDMLNLIECLSNQED